jgi:oxygen-dependent protoporphyrinogen oxidase
MNRTIDRHTVVVIGAGISGLCVAYWLKQVGVEVVVFEKDSEVGGTMKTIREGGWLVETGPNSALETTPLFQELLDDLGITEKRTYANKAAAKRYIVRNGGLHPLPMSPGSFLKSRLWTARGKLRLLKEPFVGRSDHEESISEFVARRLGREFLDYAVNPFIAGVYAGDPRQLSVRVALPKLFALEEKYGGLLKGLILGRKERRARAEKSKSRAQLFSFIDGMQSLPEALSAKLGDSVRLSTPVENIIPIRAGRFPMYTVYTSDRRPVSQDVSAVVLAGPAYATANMIRPIDPDMSKTLEAIYYPPVVEVFLGFQNEQVERSPDGFGFLVPEKEERKILGTIFSSTIFPQRAPEGTVAFTSFLGGARQPELALLVDEDLEKLVVDELQSLMKIKGEPIYSKIIRWEKAIPQYTLRYDKILKAMDRFELNFRGAFLCSNYRGGIAVGDCLMNAKKTAERVLEHLKLLSSVPEETIA